MKMFKRRKSTGSIVDEASADGVERLHQGIMDCELKLCKILLNGGVDVNGIREDEANLTPLMTVCLSWDELIYNRQDLMEIMQFLFDRGADPFKRNAHGENAYSFAKSIGLEFLNVQMCVWYNQRRSVIKKQINLTGNIVNVHPTPVVARRSSCGMVLPLMPCTVTMDSPIMTPDTPRRGSDPSTYLHRQRQLLFARKYSVRSKSISSQR